MTAETREGRTSNLPSELEWSDEDLEGSVTERLLKVAAATPEAPALVGLDGTMLTFAELRGAALTLGEQLVDRTGDGPGRVATFVDTDPGAVVAIFGILAAGKTYVPIDPVEATERVASKLEHSGATVLVAPPALMARAIEFKDERRIVQRSPHGSTESTTAPARSGPETLLNLVYTSGSTGLPKGVTQTHRNVLFETASGALDMGTRPTDRFGLVMPLTFGASVSDMLGSLLNGASLHLFDLRNRGVAAMARWMLDEAITATHMVPTVFRRWMAELEPEAHYPAMRGIKLGGEPVYHTDIAAFSRHFGPDCVLRNGLGTTETYLISSLLVSPGDSVAEGIVPVGYPVTGKQVSIRDDGGRPLPDGEIGNITVISDYLSPGYWQDVEMTSSRYGVDARTGVRTYQPGDLGRIRTDNGMLEHLGRNDDTVKINGARVELGEVEAALLELDTVAEAAVVAQSGSDGSLRLVGYVVPSGVGVNQATIRAALAARMPSHMVPSLFVEMDALPVLSFGKVDRRALPLPDGRRPELDVPYRAPTTPDEQLIAELAAEILGFDGVGVDDDFFSLGMDSLLATRLLSVAAAELGRSVGVEVVFDHPTVAGLARQFAATHAFDEVDIASLVAELEAGVDAPESPN